MLMYFTSGTSGYPKIAAHTQRYSLGHFVTAKYWHNVDPNGLHFTIADTGWGKSVWGKLYGQWLSEAAVFTYDFDKFKAEDILPLFAKYNITTFCAPPTMFRMFLLADISKYDLSSLKHVTTAGEALNREVFDQFYKVTGLKIMEGFGQTETTLTIANLVGNEIKLGSMGKPTPQYDVDIVDENGEPTKAGEVGEIVIHTDKGAPYGLFSGYYLNDEATANTWHDRMYHTGDMAWRDEDGYYWYMSRIDDVIKSSGYRRMRYNGRARSYPRTGGQSDDRAYRRHRRERGTQEGYTDLRQDAHRALQIPESHRLREGASAHHQRQDPQSGSARQEVISHTQNKRPRRVSRGRFRFNVT